MLSDLQRINKCIRLGTRNREYQVMALEDYHYDNSEEKELDEESGDDEVRGESHEDSPGEEDER